MAGSVLVEMGRVLRSAPRPGAPAVEVAAWYVRKAELLELVASERGPESASAASVAVAARVRAARLVGQDSKCQDCAGVCSAVSMRSAA